MGKRTELAPETEAVELGLAKDWFDMDYAFVKDVISERPHHTFARNREPGIGKLQYIKFTV